MKIKYEDWKPNRNSEILVTTAEDIINEYSRAGYILTLRQLYYQFVARDIIANSERSYKNLGAIITRARLAGMISWTAIEDRNRSHNGFWYEEDDLVPIQELPYFIRYDRWARQDHYIEVWVEKEALGNVISKACTPYLVPHMSCKGYLSASEAWRAGMRFQEKLEEGKNCILLHLGDHDPSGIDMTRDNRERLDLFTETFQGVNVIRLALNIDQIEAYNPPPNPAKTTDSRATGYIKKYGRKSWELDALEPSVIETLITDKIEYYIDFDIWNEVVEMEKKAKNLLSKISNKWDDIKKLL